MRLSLMAIVLGWGALAGAAQADPGRLVIAGGAVARDNADVHGAFLDGLPVEGRIAVIPAASGEPAQSAQAYIETLSGFGIAADRIDIVRLAVIDDEATPDIDESAWADNASAPAEIAKIEAAAAIWFTGGDQVRITSALLRADGTETPMLAALRARHAAGAAIGGTSAGAAIMSRTMIARGDSLAALTQPLLTADASESQMDGGALMVSAGLGFMPLGVVDQHFDRKARLGRLARTLAEVPAADRIGFGIDEDTALVVDLAQGEAFVAGVGGVTVLDGRTATPSLRRNAFAIRGLVLGHLAPGDRVSLADLTITPAPGRDRIDPARGYYTHAAQSGAGMALPNDGLEDALGVELVDNRVSDELERVSFDGDGRGVRYVFAETADTWGAYGDDATGAGRYTVSGVIFSIEPVRVSIRTVRP